VFFLIRLHFEISEIDGGGVFEHKFDKPSAG